MFEKLTSFKLNNLSAFSDTCSAVLKRIKFVDSISFIILENTFNFSTMISYVEIDALRDDNYRFAPDNVRVLLLAKLGA